MLLTPLYEQEFCDCSYGFRPGRSAHAALEALWQAIMRMGGKCWVLEVDIKSYFDTVKHEQLRQIYKQRVGDGVINRVLGKWLKAGILEEHGKEVVRPGAGTPVRRGSPAAP